MKRRNPIKAIDRAWLTSAQAAPRVWLYSDENRAALDRCCGAGWLEPIPGEFVTQHLGIQPYGEVVRLVTIYRLTAFASEWIDKPDEVDADA